MRQMTGTIEKLSDENGLLRQQAGLAAADHIDISGVQLAKVYSLQKPRLSDHSQYRKHGMFSLMRKDIVAVEAMI